MSIDELVKHLSCLRCGTRDNLTHYEYRKRYKYKTGGPPIYTIHRGVNTLKMPMCYECIPKIKRWKWFYYSSMLGLILWVVLSTVLPSLLRTYSAIEFAIVVYGGLIFGNVIIFFLASLNNPRTYVKFDSGHNAHIRPVGSNKWVSFENWTRATFSDFSIYSESQEQPINPLVWKFPLIGGIIILISVVTPTFIYIFLDGRFILDWIPLIRFDSAVNVWGDIKPVFSFNIGSVLGNPFSIFSIVVYVISVGGAYFVIQKAYILKRAGSFVERVGIYLIVFGAIFIIFILIYLFMSLPSSGYTGTFVIGSGVYGVLAGAILVILGAVIEKIKQSKSKSQF